MNPPPETPVPDLLREENTRLKQQLAAAEAELAILRQTKAADGAGATRPDAAARLAALNLMEDAIAAQRQSAQTLAQLEQEVAERRRSEESLRRSHQWLEKAERLARLGCWTINLRDHTMWASTEACRIYGIAEKAVRPYAEIRDVPLPQYRQSLDEAMRALVEFGVPYQVEFQIRRVSDGVLADIQSVAEYDQASQTALGIIRDVTEEKRAVAALRASERNYTEIFDATHEAILVHNAEGVIVDVNRAMLDMFGFASKAEIVGSGLTMANCGPDGTPYSQAAAAQWIARAQQGEPQVFEWLSRRKDGAPFWTEVSLRATQIGGRASVLAVVRDIHLRKQTEQAMSILAAGRRGPAFFEAIAQHMATALEVDDALVGILVSDGQALRVLGGWTCGQPIPPGDHALTGPLLQLVQTRQPCCHPHGVRQIFPDNRALAKRGIEGVIGIPLFDRTGQPAGLMAVLHRQPIQQEKLAQTLFKVFAHRLEMEIERMQAERVLRESEERFRQLFASMSEMVALHELVYDAAGQPVDYRILDVNAAFEAQLGYSRDHVAGQLASQVYGAPPPPYLAEYARVAQTGVPCVFEAHYAPLAKSFHISVFSPERGKFGTVTSDITERRQAEEALRASEERFTRFMRHLPGLAYLKDAQHRILFINERFTTEFGITLEQCRGRTTEELWPGAVGRRMRHDDEWVLAERKPLLTIERVEGRSGLRTYQTIKFPITQSGQALQLGGITLDVSDLLETEEALRTTSRELATISHIILDCAGSLDLHQVLERMLVYAVQITGLEGGAIYLLENDSLRLVTEREMPPAAVEAWRAQPGRIGEGVVGLAARDCRPLIQRSQEEIARQTPADSTGDPTWQFHAAFPLVAREHCLGVLRLFTRTSQKPSERSLKQLETATGQIALAVHNALLLEETRRYAGQMDVLVQARTAELEATNRELEAFAYSVSHDLRSPLRAVDGFSRMLQEDHQTALDPEGRRLLGVVRSETQRMGSLIDDLLAFSRLGRAAMRPVRLDLATLAREVWAEVRAAEPHREVELVLGPLPPVEADLPLMRQVLANLLGNAFKYTRRQPRARVEFAGEIRGEEILYRITDNGVGFDMRYVARLFGVFQRLHRAEDFEGTGVGLALVQRILHRHGGRIWAEGQVDFGATFHFALPVGPRGLPQSEGAASP